MDDTVVFRGEGPCDEFLRAVRKVAFDKGKHKDGDWLAGYASTCFAGEALRWYEGLDEDVQDDWKQLRTSMLERFPPVSEQPTPTASEPSPAFIPGNFIPTAPAAPPAAAPPAAAPPAAAPPAAAPPPPGSPASLPVTRPREIHVSPPGALPAAPPPPRPLPPTSASLSGAFGSLSLGAGTRRGRLAVMSDSSANRGWIGRSRINGYYEVTSDPSQALRVEYTPSTVGQPVDIRILESLPESNFDRLGMIWHVASPNIAARSPHNALCVAVRGPADEGMLSCGTGHAGPADTIVWSINQNGTVSPVWSPDKRSWYGLQTVVYANKTTKRVLFVADWGTWLRRNRPTNYDKANLKFEPI